MDIKILIRKYSLQNALKYGGKADAGAVIGKVLQTDASLKQDIDKIKKHVSMIVPLVNSLSVEQQREELEKLAPELLEKKEAKEKDIFAFLGIKEGQKIITAFPPEPSKYPHIGHAKAIILNHELARRYKGKFILRFEDTNPKLAKKEYYDAHIENYKWLGLDWDKLAYASDHMEEFYKYCEKLINSDDAYVCTCSQDAIKKSRLESLACKCRDRTPQENLKLWKQLPEQDETSAIVRMKIDLEHKNSAMRDPTIFRIIKEKHARLGEKYTLWPTYDFETSLMDSFGKITHRLRSKEFELRNELQRHIQKLLGFPETYIYEFARFNLEGVPSQGRIIREMIEKKELIGWDDPSLTTIMALKRRGFLAEAIKNFVLSTGITKAESTMTWDDLAVQNRRLLDKHCDRYFFLDEPVKIKVENAPASEIHLKKHPEIPERGFRTYKTNGEFYVNQADLNELSIGGLYRLMDCLNFRKEKNKFVFDSSEYLKYKDVGKKIMHYLPANLELVKADVFMPDHKLVTGVAEPEIKKLGVGDQIQFERFGFVRLDSVEKGTYHFWFTHP